MLNDFCRRISFMVEAKYIALNEGVVDEETLEL
jgi:hypothetical protein